ncbi:secretoglobin family 2B member 20-like [Arvicanthis niloticus]|uniref:secretoglobin family 2B member 20-like n=1 Tax=Arvicanthis niloticus TaxID=61156 RepID=UPI0014869DE2|nr:secretoglobin family 2B member 20-like [Arvicanthis niloticus]
MKGTLLLALLVIGELGFQTTEACIPFFTSYAAVLSPSRAVLHYRLSSFDASVGERIALEKLQDCYDEGRLENIALNPQTLEPILFSKQCLSYYTKDTIAKAKGILANVLPF